MKKLKKKKILFILILLIVISSTVAYLYSTDTFQNIFVAASYKVVVTETFESPESWVPGDTTPKTATLKNEGTVPIKVRVKLEESWKDSNNQDLPLQHNEENVAIINFANQDDYIYKDGYYYYDLPLNPGETTSSIIESVTFNTNYSGTITCIENDDSTHTCSSSESGYEGGTYKLTLTIEGVQEDFYVQAWGLSGIVEKPLLYNVLKKESESNGLAREYTGEHHDSFTEEPAKNIYHWYAENDTDGTSILDKNNVVFGEHCWQMIRTTDTGGVKMIYNGEAVDNQCLNNRGSHVGYITSDTVALSDNYWYGTDYTYDSVAKTFKLSGTTEQVSWNDITGPNLIGKYTCKSTNVNGVCSFLYLVESYYNTSSAYVIVLNLYSNYSQFGTLKFNANHNSPVSVGYQYGTVYRGNYANTSIFQDFTTKETLLNSLYLSTSYWYSDSISYDSATGKYSLVNPYKITSSADYSSLAGKYTFNNSNQIYDDTNVYYIVGVSNSKMYYKQLFNGDLLSDYEPILIGDSIIDNGDNSYTINNPVSISLSDWFINYANYNNYYICGDGTVTCLEPMYLTSTASYNYSYIRANEKILIGKSRDGVNLIDTLIVRKDEWYKNWNNYDEYKYTCNTTSPTCTEETLRMILDYSRTGYSFMVNHYYGRSVTWDGSSYTLIDPIEMENFNNLRNLSTHHYFCVENGLKNCSSVAYAYSAYSRPGTTYYILLENGVSSVTKALEDMLTKNTNDSIIKTGVEAWYKHYMLDYDKYIEDTIFCNDRTIRSLGGWNPDGGYTDTYISFYKSTSLKNLSCTNIMDKFCVSNPDAKLVYKVGLVSGTEMNLLNNNNIRKNGGKFWTITPSNFHYSSSPIFIDSNGNLTHNGSVSLDYGVRPTISLKSGIEYESGDGSMNNPYIVKMD